MAVSSPLKATSRRFTVAVTTLVVVVTVLILHFGPGGHLVREHIFGYPAETLNGETHPGQASWEDAVPSGRPSYDEFVNESERKALVFPPGHDTDMDWTIEIPSVWKIHMSSAGGNQLAPAYLSFIVRNYRKFPSHAVFVRGQYQPSHQAAPLPHLLRALNLSAVDQHGWVNLRCAHSPSCAADSQLTNTTATSSDPGGWLQLARRVCAYIYRPGDSWYDETLPEVDGLRVPTAFATPIGSQFAVSREVIWSKPLDFWRRTLNVFTANQSQLDVGHRLQSDESDVEPADDQGLGAVYERIWPYLFGLESVACLPEDYCQKHIYQSRLFSSTDDSDRV